MIHFPTTLLPYHLKQVRQSRRRSRRILRSMIISALRLLIPHLALLRANSLPRTGTRPSAHHTHPVMPTSSRASANLAIFALRLDVRGITTPTTSEISAKPHTRTAVLNCTGTMTSPRRRKKRPNIKLAGPGIHQGAHISKDGKHIEAQIEMNGETKTVTVPRDEVALHPGLVKDADHGP